METDHERQGKSPGDGEQTQRLTHDPLLKQVPEVEGYKVLEPCVLYAKVGEGGMGAVYRGRHLNLDIDVAIKCLKNVLAEQSPNFVTRFQREARIAASVHHQNLVQVYDISHKNGVHYLVMEFVRGETARERVTRKKALSETEACKILMGAASGLAEAHAQKIVHRDIKPDNILISFDGKVKVSDLGLAKALEVDAGPSITMGVMGTPQYMAPEQWDDSIRVGPTADVWALGATFYYLLTGEHAIPGGSMQQIYKKICVDKFPDIREKVPSLSPSVYAILDRCIQRDPKKRFQDCRELLKELSRLVVKDAFPGVALQIDAESGTMRVPPLISPPPAETLGHIKVAIQGEDGGTMEVKRPAGAVASGAAATARAATPPPRAPVPNAAVPTPAGAARSSNGWKWALAAVPVLAVIGWYATRGKGVEEGSPRSEPPRTAQPDPGTKEVAPGVAANLPLDEHKEPDTTLPPRPASERTPDDRPGIEGKPVPASAPKPVAKPVPRLALAEIRPITSERTLLLNGTIEPPGRVRLVLSAALGGETVFPTDEDGTFSRSIDLVEEGHHTIEFRSDESEAAEPVSIEILYDATAPRITLPSDLPKRTRDATLDVTVEASDELAGVARAWVEHDGRTTELDGSGNAWTAGVPLSDGGNELVFQARDLAGNSRTADKIQVELDRKAPAFLRATPPAESALSPGARSLRLEFDEPVIELVVDGASLAPEADDPRAVVVHRNIAADAASLSLSIVARDDLGNASSEPRVLRWPVDNQLRTPPGFQADPDSEGVTLADESYWARRVIDPTTNIAFVLVPEQRIYLAETEVTRRQWAGEDTEGPDLPATGVSWPKAQEFCKRHGYRLPTAEEWRRACLAGSTGRYSFGDDEKLLSKYAWSRKDGVPGPQPVAGKEPNRLGLYDMHGNVLEWCADLAENGHDHLKLGGWVYSTSCAVDEPPAFATNGGPDTGFRPTIDVR